MSHPSVGKTPMSGAERQARDRAVHTDGTSVIRIRRPAGWRSRIQRRNDTITGLADLHLEYAALLDALPANQQDSATAEAVQAIVDFDLSELP